MDSANKRLDLHFIRNSFLFERIEMNSGEVLFTEGQENEFVFFIEKGAIKVFKNKCVIGITRGLEFVGITSCLSDANIYTFSSKAIEPSSVLKIAKIDFKNLLLNNSFFCQTIIETLCERIKLTDLKTRSYIEQPSQYRLISELINNSKNIENSLKTFLGVEDLSELTGISKRAVKKMLNDLSKQNLILQGKDNEIHLLDQLKLKEMVQRGK